MFLEEKFETYLKEKFANKEKNKTQKQMSQIFKLISKSFGGRHGVESRKMSMWKMTQIEN